MRSTQLATIPRKPTPKQNLPGLPYEPSLIVRPGSLEGVRIDLTENFKDEHVSDVRIANESTYRISSRNGLAVFVNSEKAGVQIVDDPVILFVTSENGKQIMLSIPVDTVGVVKLSPSFVQLRKVGEEYSVLLMVYGLDQPNGDDFFDVSIGRNDDLELKGQVVKSQRRSERGCLIVATFTVEQIRALLGGSQNEMYVRVADRKKTWVCESKLFMSR